MAEKQPYPRFVTPYKYARLCNVSDTAIYGRIQRGVLKFEEKEAPDGTMKRYIDTVAYPPARLIDYPIETKKNSGPK